MSGDSDRLRKALTWAGIAVSLTVLVLVFARCATPSTLSVVDPSAPPGGTDAINAVAAGTAAVSRWGGEPSELVSLTWLSPDSALLTARVAGQIVQVTSNRTDDDRWEVFDHPKPVAAVEDPVVEPYPPVPGGVGGDPRWQVIDGFLRTWINGEDTERWTARSYTPRPLSIEVESYEIVGLADSVGMEGGTAERPIQLAPLDVSATVDGTARTYRIIVALQPDQTGRWVVIGIAHQLP